MNVLAMLEHLAGKAPQQWVASPRVHHQYLPDELGFEPWHSPRNSSSVCKLKAMY